MFIRGTELRAYITTHNDMDCCIVYIIIPHNILSQSYNTIGPIAQYLVRSYPLIYDTLYTRRCRPKYIIIWGSKYDIDLQINIVHGCFITILL